MVANYTKSKLELLTEIIAKLKAAIKYEIETEYVNSKGKSGTFAEFIYKEASKAHKIFEHSSNWFLIKTLIERYEFQDQGSRLVSLKKIREILDELSNVYQNETIKQANPKPEKGNINKDIDLGAFPIKFLKGVGPVLGAKLEKLGLHTAEDLLNYLPRDYISYDSRTFIKDLKEGEDTTVLGEIKQISAYKSPQKNLVIINIIVQDHSGKLKITKYYQGNSSHFYLKQLKKTYPSGAKVLVAGRVIKDKFSKKPSFQNPVIEIITDDFIEGEDNLHTGRIVPIYPLTEGLSLFKIRSLISYTINQYEKNIHEYLPKEILESENLLDYSKAISEIHFPSSLPRKDKAAERLLFNEFFLLQLKLAQHRHNFKSINKGIKFNVFENGLVDKFINSLPFKLTNAQQRVFNSEILPDLVNEAPMHRLLQGDVGSGKTVVAFLSMLVAVSDGYQAAIMVPTEILAEQHYKRFLEWIENIEESLKIKIALLIGKTKTRIKKEIKTGLKNGTINIVVGTHALIQDDVEFNNLGLTVIDEQHRFGVKQREQLAFKASEKLFMTATPIPRTLALVMHGDLDISEIDEVPLGRKTIKTEIVSKKSDAYKLIKLELEKGHQAYIVFPLIEESETLSAKAATVEFEKLQKQQFKDYELGIIHGRLGEEEKDLIMERFRKKEIKLLVSTTVIEVGVDVPNATVILIESAERFGLAQLHQLRGRVGRSDKQSYCLLSSSNLSNTAYARLQILCKSNNGFFIAQQDLKHRGAGEYLGLKQSGLPDSVLHNISDYENVIQKARTCARKIIDENPDLSKYPKLKSKLKSAQQHINIEAG